MVVGRRAVLAGVGSLPIALAAAAAEPRSLLIAEPVHSIGYLPLYVAVHKGLFDGLAVRTITIESGSGHINAVLSNQAFAFIGGPEHDAFAKLKGAELRSVANVVNRGNIYVVAKSGLAVSGDDMAATLKGRSVATGFYGGTPNSIGRYLCAKAGLSTPGDVKLIETTTAGALAAIRAGQAELAMVGEPQLTQGIRAGLWGEPVYNVPDRLGPYAYSTLNVRKDTIDKEPAVVEAFVTGVMKGLRFTYDNPAEASSIARLEFPTMSEEDMRATLDRSFKDQIWSKDGLVSPESWTTAQAVVTAAGLLKQEVPYDAIIDMSFVRKA